MITRLAYQYLEGLGTRRRYLKNRVTVEDCTGPLVEKKIESRQLRESALKLLSDLHINKAEVFRLRVFEQLSYQEIATVLGIAEKSARLYYGEALKHIRAHGKVILH